MHIGPALSYFGSKWRAAKHYPCPEYGTIIEPFAGGAGYSLLHYTHDVNLIDSYRPVVDAWRLIIQSSGDEILNLPDVSGQIDDLDVSVEAKSLIGYWVNKSVERPRKAPSRWMSDYPSQFWGPEIRQKLAIVRFSGPLDH